MSKYKEQISIISTKNIGKAQPGNDGGGII